jgi:hypothetical protein
LIEASCGGYGCTEIVSNSGVVRGVALYAAAIPSSRSSGASEPFPGFRADRPRPAIVALGFAPLIAS